MFFFSYAHKASRLVEADISCVFVWADVDPSNLSARVCVLSPFACIYERHTTPHPSTILGAVKGQKPYYPPPKPPVANATTSGERHMDAFAAAAEKMATGVIARAKEIMRHPAFQKVCVYVCIFVWCI